MNEDKKFAIRSVACYFLIMLLLLICSLRVAVIAMGDYGELCNRQNEYTVKVGKTRGTVYDCNMTPLTNTTQKLMAAISPVDTVFAVLQDILSEGEYERVYKLLKQGKPVVCEVERQIKCDGISYINIYDVNSGEEVAIHTIGYLNDKGDGVSGIQNGYNDILYSSESVEAVFQIAGDGSVLKGIEPSFRNVSVQSDNAVVTTIDLSIQKAAEKAGKYLKKGAIVVSDVQSGKIRAILSKPTFDKNKISDALNSDDAPLINRALAAFSVGSVFKPCVAAAALEQGVNSFVYNCTGSSLIIDRSFNCHYRSGHGMVNMKKAIAYSCNTFFYNFAIRLGATPIYNMASSLSFGQCLNIAKNMKTAKGNLTKISELTNDAQIANLSIGQGNLSLSPVSLLTLYSAIANGGSYHVPSLVEKTLVEGVWEEYGSSAKTKVFSEETAQVLRESLLAVIEEGTGVLAKPKRVSAAGKTATAQTGRYDENGKEITNSWFCGYFPVETPKYVVVVLSEGESEISTGQIFSMLADEIC